MDEQPLFSPFISRLARKLRAFGWTVDLHADLNNEAAGRVYYAKKLVQIDCHSAENALITLAHEAGHVLDYLRRPQADRRLSAERPDRERRAYLLGWAILTFMGCRLITKEMWKAAHPEVLALEC